MLVASLAAQLVCLLVALRFSARRTIRAKGSFDGVISGTLVLYALGIGLCFLFSVVIPAMLMWFGMDKGTVLDSFPDATGNVPAVFLGWLPALVFAVIVRRVYEEAEPAEKMPCDNPSEKPCKRL